MKTVGLIGGIAPESTIEYYRSLISECRSRTGDQSYPPIVINSIDLTKMVGLIGANELDAVTDYLSAEIQKLANAGADFAALASNTPHIVFDELRARASIPMVSIVEAACESAHERGLRRVGLFGTKFTMNGEFYPRVFSSRGIEVVAPDPEERAYVHEKYVNELIPGIFLTETRERLLEIAARMRERDHVEAIVLGGTELPLILKDAPSSGPALLDTTKIHVEKIVREMLGPRDGR